MIAAIEWEAAGISAERRAELDAWPPVTVTEVSPVLAVACGLFIRQRSVSLADQRDLALMLGLDAPQAARPGNASQVQAWPDAYRRGTKGRGQR